MKKLLSFLAALLCVIALSAPAFAVGADAYAIYQKSVKKLKSVSSMELSFAIKYFTEAGLVFGTSDSTKILRTSGNKLQAASEYADIIDSKTMEPDYGYYKDGRHYTKSGDEKYSVRTDAARILENIFDYYFLVWYSPNGDKDYFKNAVTEKIDGNTKITLKKKVSVPPPLFEDPGWRGNNGTVFANHTITIIIGDDGLFKSRTDSYVYLTNGGKATKSKVTIKVNAKSVNSITKIDFPADLDSYKPPEN